MQKNLQTLIGQLSINLTDKSQTSKMFSCCKVGNPRWQKCIREDKDSEVLFAFSSAFEVVFYFSHIEIVLFCCFILWYDHQMNCVNVVGQIDWQIWHWFYPGQNLMWPYMGKDSAQLAPKAGPSHTIKYPFPRLLPQEQNSLPEMIIWNLL